MFKFISILLLTFQCCFSAIENKDFYLLEHAMFFASRHRYEDALELTKHFRQIKKYDEKLIDAAERAIKLSKIANTYSSWQGSDFGEATPWFIEKPDVLSVDYFNIMIEHSLNRLYCKQAELKK